MTYSAGQTFGSWTLEQLLGRGGSGEVWRASNCERQEVALKLLHSYEGRFRDEVKVYSQLGRRSGILPYVDSYLPRVPRESDPAWIAMEIGTPITDFLGPAPDLTSVVNAVKSYGATLIELADIHVHHRDLKPPNLYWRNGKFLLGDFGIADFPGKAGLTTNSQKLGPGNFIAPEMIWSPTTAASEPADVYSLAKTLWALATGRVYPPPGEFRTDRSELRLSSQTGHGRAFLLDELLEKSTSDNPTLRPSMIEFVSALEWWAAPKPAVALMDVSDLASEIEVIRQSITLVKEDSIEHRNKELRQELHDRLFPSFLAPIEAKLAACGLARLSVRYDETLGDWYWALGERYTGSHIENYWGIETLARPWIGFHVAFGEPVDTMNSEKVSQGMVVQAMFRTADAATILYEFRRDISLAHYALEEAIEAAQAGLIEIIPKAISQFVIECKASGIPAQAR